MCLLCRRLPCSVVAPLLPNRFPSLSSSPAPPSFPYSVIVSLLWASPCSVIVTDVIHCHRFLTLSQSPALSLSPCFAIVLLPRQKMSSDTSSSTSASVVPSLIVLFCPEIIILFEKHKKCRLVCKMATRGSKYVIPVLIFQCFGMQIMSNSIYQSAASLSVTYYLK